MSNGVSLRISEFPNPHPFYVTPSPMIRTRFTALLALSTLLGFPALSPLRAHEASAEMAMAAKHFTAALTAEQKTKALVSFDDQERKNWHYVPKARQGLPIKEMTHDQRLLAHGLLATGLSHRGYLKAVSIMSLEAILVELEKGRGPVRDSELYYFTIFGTPGMEPWGWRVEGHHLSLNFTSAGGAVPAVTPSFFGSNPGDVREGARAGMRPLAKEEELGRALIKSLAEDQRKEAVILAEAPREIFNAPGRIKTEPEGIRRPKLSEEQKAGLTKLIQEYLGSYRPDVAAEDWKKIEAAGLDNLAFCWAGGMEQGQPHYYRVQGPTFVLEYDNTQNGANHVHSVWRDMAGDFGEDLLKKHIEQAHAGN